MFFTIFTLVFNTSAMIFYFFHLTSLRSKIILGEDRRNGFYPLNRKVSYLFRPYCILYHILNEKSIEELNCSQIVYNLIFYLHQIFSIDISTACFFKLVNHTFYRFLNFRISPSIDIALLVYMSKFC